MQKAFDMTGRVEAVLVASTFGEHVSRPVKKIQVVRRYGIRGDNHAGARLADAREQGLVKFGLPKGIEIANHREFSAVSVEQMAEVAAAMGITGVPRGCLGENVVVSGIPRFTELPPGTLLFFRNGTQPRTAVLAVWGENTPCVVPGEELQSRFPSVPNLARLFPKAAMGRRGVVGSVYCSGTIGTGDEIVVKVPAQKIYLPA